ncbi:hypothetical protein FisN_6Hh171 [Fistulifera solaris]|jgi:hypothetical protein|uniref:Uncharacterized protein n=1 Tax=Fistulifera solaris TaxID=1519565 RepID=A0A1Z5JNW3_FISSO|nr:hypothetical protein FisN_6Hh171 [Fistulifera solaris]|eukprot:GAX15532.1 hypothetical protein FisN_6Hh171 [Fistulifera solaris]
MAEAEAEDVSSVNVQEVNEDDEEVRLALEMAMAAAKHPNLSPAELRKLLGEKNEQAKIVEEAERKVQKKKEEQAAKEWEAKKEAAYHWFSSKAEDAAKFAADKKWEAEKQYYAEAIKRDKEIIEIRKKMKICRKALKAHRLQGNRVETRHCFKRAREEKMLLATQEKIVKNTKLLTHTGFNVQEYAKAMMKASKKWKKVGSKEEVALEAQLCRNMHQMLAIEKQKAKLHKGSREIKKYLQRCKSWLSDKKAFCEMHFMTLDATASSMRILYQDTLSKQDALIRRLRESDEFEGVDFGDVDLTPFQELEAVPGPSAMLNALRGLPIQDSVRLTKEEGKLLAAAIQAAVAEDADDSLPAGAPEIYIEAKDDVSVSSHLTDDGHEEEEVMAGEDDDSESVEFGADAPWNRPLEVEDEQENKDKKKKKKTRADTDDNEPLNGHDEAEKTTEKLNGKKGDSMTDVTESVTSELAGTHIDSVQTGESINYSETENNYVSEVSETDRNED